MEILPLHTAAAACLELSIAMPSAFSSPSPSSSAGAKGGGGAMKLLDINEAPSRSGEESMEEEEDEESPNRGRGPGPAPRKKLRLTKEQSRYLEQSFLQNQTLNPKEKEVLAMDLRLKPRQVEVWFQNRRARSKMKQTEIECEYLKRWFGALTEQNMKLQREVEELRSKAPPAAAGRQPPPQVSTALTMCPRCERVTTSASSEGKAPFLQRRSN